MSSWKMVGIKNNISGIYILYDIQYPNRVYIGSSKNIKRRIREHFSMLKRGNHHNKKLQNFVNKYSINRIGYCILYKCKSNLLEEYESKCIEELESFKRNSFNMTKSTNRHTEETIKIISEKAKIRQSKEDVKEKLKIENSGENNPNSKLSNKDIKYIRENFIRTGLKKSNTAELASKFKVSSRTINRIILNQTYKSE